MKENMQLNDFVVINHNRRQMVADRLSDLDGVTQAQKEFLTSVGKALEIVDYEFAIPDLLDKDNPMKETGRALNALEWEVEAKAFAPKYGSTYANKQELHLYYAYKVMLGRITLAELCDLPAEQERYYAVMDVEGGYALCGGNRGLPKPYAATLRYTNPYEVNAFASWLLVLRDVSKWRNS